MWYEYGEMIGELWAFEHAAHRSGMQGASSTWTHTHNQRSKRTSFIIGRFYAPRVTTAMAKASGKAFQDW